MTLRVALLRHGDTAWSAEGRIQGRTDVPLSDSGRAAIRALSGSPFLKGMRVVTSPLSRCVETASLIGAPAAEREPRLAEMSWGAWEGRSLAELRAELGESMRANEARGWDFRPDGGESPREVFARVTAWLKELTVPTLAVTHRGVIRAMLAAATGWDMLGKPPVTLEWGSVHLFSLDRDARPLIERMNLK